MREKILEYLKTQTMPQTPTQIGLAIGKSYNQASSSVCKHLQKLLLDGKVSRTKWKNVVLYECLNKAQS